MPSIADWFADKLERAGIPRPQCSACGNPHFGELAIGLTGEIHCRQDIPEIRDACEKKIGWRVLDPNGRVVQRGPGITLTPNGSIKS